MAIQTPGEFDVVLSDVVLKVDRMLHERPGHPPLVNARRQIAALGDCARRGQKPTAKQLEAFAAAAETVRGLGGDDAELADKLYDLADWIDPSRGGE